MTANQKKIGRETAGNPSLHCTIPTECPIFAFFARVGDAAGATFVRSTPPVVCAVVVPTLRKGRPPLLLGPRLRGHKTCEAVVHNELAVVFTAMFDNAVGNVENARFLITVYDSLHQAFLAL